jgi:cytochrome b
MSSEKSGTVRVLVWDVPVRVFHWVLVASFAGAYALGDTERLRQWHVTFGYTVLGLVAFRLAWGFVGTEYARFRSFAYGPGAAAAYLRDLFGGRAQRHLGHNPAGSLAIWAMLLLAAATGATGYCTLNEIGGEAVEEAHEFLANAWLAVVLVHVAGVLASSLAHRENLATTMITGYKDATVQSAERGAGASSRLAVGLLGAVAVLAFWVGSAVTGGPDLGGRASESTVAGGEADDDD